MPSTSAAQHRAMGAAAGGNSTLGIPKSVGKEFMMADALRKKAAPKSYGGSNAGGGSIGSATA